jgi:hypothetical protein
MTRYQKLIWDALVSLDGKTVLSAITDYHGMQIFDEDFGEFLVTEGLLDPEVVGWENEEKDEEV